MLKKLSIIFLIISLIVIQIPVGVLAATSEGNEEIVKVLPEGSRTTENYKTFLELASIIKRKIKEKVDDGKMMYNNDFKKSNNTSLTKIALKVRNSDNSMDCSRYVGYVVYTYLLENGIDISGMMESYKTDYILRGGDNLKNKEFKIEAGEPLQLKSTDFANIALYLKYGNNETYKNEKYIKNNENNQPIGKPITDETIEELSKYFYSIHIDQNEFKNVSDTVAKNKELVKNNCQPGDILIYFGKNKEGKERGHVEIYVGNKEVKGKIEPQVYSCGGTEDMKVLEKTLSTGTGEYRKKLKYVLRFRKELGIELPEKISFIKNDKNNLKIKVGEFDGKVSIYMYNIETEKYELFKENEDNSQDIIDIPKAKFITSDKLEKFDKIRIILRNKDEEIIKTASYKVFSRKTKNSKGNYFEVYAPPKIELSEIGKFRVITITDSDGVKNDNIKFSFKYKTKNETMVPYLKIKENNKLVYVINIDNISEMTVVAKDNKSWSRKEVIKIVKK